MRFGDVSEAGSCPFLAWAKCGRFCLLHVGIKAVQRPAFRKTCLTYDNANTLLKTVALDYSGLPAPTSNVDFTHPSVNGQTGVSTSPTFTWTIDPAAGSFLALGVDDQATGHLVHGAYPVPMTTGSWSPGPLLAEHDYHLDVTVSRVKDWVGPGLPSMTVEGDEFFYYLTFDSINTIAFTTAQVSFTIGGAIYTDPNNPLTTGLEGVTVTVSGDNETYQATTSGTFGLWQISDVNEGIYTVYPQLSGWGFKQITNGEPNRLGTHND